MSRAWTAACVTAIVLTAQTAAALPDDPGSFVSPIVVRFPAAARGAGDAMPGADRVWRVKWGIPAEQTASGRPSLADLAITVDWNDGTSQGQQTPGGRPVATEISKGHEIRLKTHKYASIATLPLFVTEFWLGQSLYNHPGESESKRSAHGAVAAATGVLFGVNSVTGVWNLVESRKEPAGRTRRILHGILMLTADAGFVATGLLAPDEEGGEEGRAGQPVNAGSRSTHRTVALTSMGVALTSYLMMLIWRD